LFAIRPLTSNLNPEKLFLHSDWIAHALYFGVLWLLSRRAGFAAGWPLALCLLGYGVSIEVAQHLAPTGRSASLGDVAADAAGIALAWSFTRRSFGQPEKHRR
jgi:VanZ family protein